MGLTYSKSFTEEGVKRLYQYFLINVLIIFLGLLTIALLLIGITNPQSFLYIFIAINVLYFTFFLIIILIAFESLLRYFLLMALFISTGLGFIIGLLSFYIVFIISLFLLIWGVTYLLIGRKEFGKKHKLFVTIAFGLSIAYFVLYIVNIALSGLTANIALSSYYLSDVDIAQNLFLSSIISIVQTVLINLAAIFFVYDLSNKKMFLLIAFVLGILSPFTFGLTGIISLLLYFMLYKSVYDNLYSETKKPKLMVPCPFCNREIPIESSSCIFCGQVFEKHPDFKIEDELGLDMPKKVIQPPEEYQGNVVLKQKNFLFLLIGVIIAIAVIIAILFMPSMISDEEKITGNWKLDTAGLDVDDTKWSFFKNGSLKISILDDAGLERVGMESWSYWEIEDDMIYMGNETEISTDTATAFKYEFTNNDNTLTIYTNAFGNWFPVSILNRL